MKKDSSPSRVIFLFREKISVRAIAVTIPVLEEKAVLIVILLCRILSLRDYCENEESKLRANLANKISYFPRE